MKELDSEERLRLLRLACSVAWADAEIQQHERGYIAKLMFQIGAPAEEIRQVKKWLDSPPPEEDFDPCAIPVAHRELFLQACRGVMAADGKVTPEEEAELNRLTKKLGLAY
ncbi:MAG TPA: TerB family tellurite resistance protein [Polyangiaceae bacterium]|jgi:uncharacterized tellurite resistance protein B-like protein|nr:MAG: Tellurite resistance protein TerB [Deltaproteobacteria bacterium ADurb.Bin207]HNS99949.1 TerB family tellurite resistance protein [Polyangiaceae bacterium]HNZ22198.1 TerB family tellurite resistance protein [Polyangiaceae bacterium]HOD23959.1 TerB family tellurite resistance protein [Polyangiaceae bacterium]HOE47022.1 TerB family tellurite resistance protein [Polyangiaceae bacterium]